MANNGNTQAPSFIVYREYFNRRAKGQDPKHLYDGFNGDNSLVTKSHRGPFADPPNGADNIDNDVAQQSLSTKFPGVTMISPNVAGEDRARSLVAEDQARELQEQHKKSMLPPEGVVSDPDQNPHLAPTSETYRQANSDTGHYIRGTKRKRELSVVDLRDKLLQSPTWNKRQKKN